MRGLAYGDGDGSAYGDVDCEEDGDCDGGGNVSPDLCLDLLPVMLSQNDMLKQCQIARWREMRRSMREAMWWLRGEEDADGRWRMVFAAADRRNVIYHDPNSFLQSGVLPPNTSVFFVEILDQLLLLYRGIAKSTPSSRRNIRVREKMNVSCYARKRQVMYL